MTELRFLPNCSEDFPGVTGEQDISNP